MFRGLRNALSYVSSILRTLLVKLAVSLHLIITLRENAR